MAYHLEGRLLEVCNCRVLCPCWIGEDPDYGTCNTIVAWHIDKGKVDGVDVSGRTIAMIAHVPGNILQGNWKAAVFLDERVSPDQEQALLAVYTGKKGGPVAELAKLVGEVVSVERTPITLNSGLFRMPMPPCTVNVPITSAWRPCSARICAGSSA